MKLTHLKTSQSGEFVKEFKATGRPYYSTVIRLDDGREYVAPSYEFKAEGESKYIKTGYVMSTTYMKVSDQTADFYKGLRLDFNKKENDVNIITDAWFDFKSIAYMTVQITEEEFIGQFEKAIKILELKAKQ